MLPSTAVLLQHKRVDDDGGFGVVVKCIVVAVASVCGFASAEASPARRKAQEIVEMRRRWQRLGEYGGVDGDPGGSCGSGSRRRRA